MTPVYYVFDISILLVSAI